MRRTIRNLTGYTILMVFPAMLLCQRCTRANYIATISQNGSNVVMTGTGTINTTALVFKPSTSGGDFDTGYSVAYAAGLGIGPAVSTQVDKYTGTFTGPTAFGTSHSLYPDLGSGDMVEFAKFANVLDVPRNYVSGSALSSSSTFTNKTISGLFLTEGTYQWTWGTGPTFDSYNLTITPEPSSVALFAAGCTALLLRRKRKNLP